MGVLAAVEPSERYAHPRNADLLRHLKKSAVAGTGDVTDLDGYRLHTHPDLCDYLEAFNRSCYAGAYGVPLLVNDLGVIFAVASGTSLLAFLLPEPEQSEAKAAGAVDYLEAGAGWIFLPAWSTGKDLLSKWCLAAHAYANTIGKGKIS
jgi:hypothetical protein